ncbi:MAG: hypothetical protein ABIV47_00990 [Roseiflexaceae bacterium]
MISGNFYSNDLLVKIRMDERMAEAYRRATQVEQSNVNEQPTRRVVFRPFGWMRRLALRIGGVGA